MERIGLKNKQAQGKKSHLLCVNELKKVIYE